MRKPPAPPHDKKGCPQNQPSTMDRLFGRDGHDWRYSMSWGGTIEGLPGSTRGSARSGFRCHNCGKFDWDQSDLQYAFETLFWHENCEKLRHLKAEAAKREAQQPYMHDEYGTVWVIEAYLAVNPERPTWSPVEATAITGWSTWYDHPNRLRDGGLRFNDEDVAHAAFRDLIGQEQKYWLRLTRVYTRKVETQVAGHLIRNGTVVKNPQGEKPTFMRREVEGCVEELPERMV